MASCFHSFSTDLSPSLSPLPVSSLCVSLFFIFLSQQIHLNAILFLKRPSHACLMNVRSRYYNEAEEGPIGGVYTSHLKGSLGALQFYYSIIRNKILLQ